MFGKIRAKKTVTRFAMLICLSVVLSAILSPVLSVNAATTAPILYNNTDGYLKTVTFTGKWVAHPNRGLGDYKNDVNYCDCFGFKNNFPSVTIKFTGTGIDYITEKYNDMVKLNIYIDGKFVKQVDPYNKTRLLQQVVYSKKGLKYGTHTLKVEGTKADTVKRWIILDAYRVYP